MVARWRETGRMTVQCMVTEHLFVGSVHLFLEQHSCQSSTPHFWRSKKARLVISRTGAEDKRIHLTTRKLFVILEIVWPMFPIVMESRVQSSALWTDCPLYFIIWESTGTSFGPLNQLTHVCQSGGVKWNPLWPLESYEYSKSRGDSILLHPRKHPTTSPRG